MELGLTEMEAVGAGGAGGGGGGGGAAFFLQAPSVITALSAIISRNHFIFCCFTLFPPCDPKGSPWGQTKRYLLFPTPIGLGVVARKSQLLHFSAVGQHCPDFFFSRPDGLKHDVPSIRRPRWRVIASAIVRELNKLL